MQSCSMGMLWVPEVSNPFFWSKLPPGNLPITDFRMTRSMISLSDGIKLVEKAFGDMKGGEIYVKKIPSMKVTDLAKALAPDADLEEVDCVPGENP